MHNRQVLWQQRSGKWYVTENGAEGPVKAAELSLRQPLRHSEVRAALLSRFDADPSVLGAIKRAPGEYTPVWDNTAGTILPIGDVEIPTLEDDHAALDSPRS